MSSAVLFMSMSLDGFITGPDPTPDDPLGEGGERLHEWCMPAVGEKDSAVARHRLPRGANRDVFDEVLATGAVLAGRGTFEGAGGWGGDHHDGVPIFILSRGAAPDWAAQWPGVRYTSDLAGAMRDAKAAAGDRNVLVHGAGVVAQQALAAGLLDELEITVVPVLFGNGRRLFDVAAHHELERTRVLEGDGGVTHLHYRVRSGA